MLHDDTLLHDKIVLCISKLFKVSEHLLWLYQPAALLVPACDIVHLSLYKPAPTYIALLWPSATRSAADSFQQQDPLRLQ